MPIQRFRDLREAEKALWLPSGDPSLPARMRHIWSLSFRLAGGRLRIRGVHKFRSIEDADAHRQAAVQERVGRLRISRRSSSTEN